MKKPSPDNLSRRTVLAGSLGLGLTAILGGPALAASVKGKRPKILIVGGGIGGLVAAIGLARKASASRCTSRPGC